jgi:hypothetical protein
MSIILNRRLTFQDLSSRLNNSLLYTQITTSYRVHNSVKTRLILNSSKSLTNIINNQGRIKSKLKASQLLIKVELMRETEDLTKSKQGRVW